ncbi:MAG TPA: hypothetical protein VGM41_08305 [Chitinophagaceae bacterium]
MDKEYFLAGKLFNYSGHFQTLCRSPLRLDEEAGFLIDADHNDTWMLLKHDDWSFTVWKSTYGTIRMTYKDCEPVKPKQ